MATRSLVVCSWSLRGGVDGVFVCVASAKEYMPWECQVVAANWIMLLFGGSGRAEVLEIG